MPRSHIHCLGSKAGIHIYDTHLGSHNSRAKGVLGRRPIMIVCTEYGVQDSGWIQDRFRSSGFAISMKIVHGKDNEAHTDVDLHSNGISKALSKVY